MFCDKVDAYCLVRTGKRKPMPTFKILLDVNPFHQVICQLINKNGDFENVFSNLHPEVVKNIDSMANLWRSIKRIEEYIHTHNIIADAVSEIGYIQALTNIQMLLRFMMLDLTAVVDAYIKSASNIEYALIFRRVCVIKVATMVHLRGYNNEEYERSIWKFIERITPFGLREDGNKIGILLDKIVANSPDKDLRNTFVHFFDNSCACTEINGVVSAIEKVNPIVQVFEIRILLEVYKLLMKFTTKLMNALADDAHKKTLKSNKAFNDSITDFIRIIVECGMPDDQKKQLIDKINHIRGKIDDLML